ncbi:MAG: DNA-processing protein DprA [Elusimicrobia bacterium]|nr:DNA-processing protein DprA [Elusimicrobiota bacterium]
MNNEQLSLVALNMIIELIPKKMISLIDYFGSAENVFKGDKEDIKRIAQVTDQTAETIKNFSDLKCAEEEIKLAEKNNIKVVTYKDEEYPEPLKDICDYPSVLYIKGNYSKQDEFSVSIVGSRRPTNYGRIVTDKFCKHFVGCGLTTISGLASGIDTQTHISTLDNGGKTIAVLGNGLLDCYPKENKKLQETIYEKGAVISEFPLRQRPDKINFPRRNRIVAALSKATLVVEAALKSGSLITAELAAEYGKDVFAVPGPIYARYSEGPNSLIKNGAFTALKPEDIIEQTFSLFDFVKTVKKNEKENKLKLVSDDKNSLAVLKILKTSITGLSLDQISASTGISVSDLSSILLQLELDGFIKEMPGQVYIKI